MKESYFTYNDGKNQGNEGVKKSVEDTHICPDCGKRIRTTPSEPPAKEPEPAPIPDPMPLPEAEFDEQKLVEGVQRADSARRPDKKTNQNPTIEALTLEEKESQIYTLGYLKSQLSKNVSIFTLLGQELKEHSGKLTRVGANFIVLEENNSEQVLCDLNSIKFIKIT